MAYFLFMEDPGNNSSFSRFNSCLLLVRRKWNHKFFDRLFSTSKPHKGDWLSQSTLGYKLILFVLLIHLFIYLLFLFFYLFIYLFFITCLTSTVFTRGNWCWRHDNGGSFFPRGKFWLRLPKSCTGKRLFNFDLVWFTYLFAHSFIFSTVHSPFLRNLTLDTWWWKELLALRELMITLTQIMYK